MKFNMSNKTKILVIPLKELIIGVIIAVLLIILSIFAISSFGGSKESNPGNNTSGGNKASATYHPGVYTSSVMLNGTPIDIKVTVDANNINDIEMVNLNEAITTMYPAFQTSFDEIAAAVKEKGSTANIGYDTDNKYTSTMLLSAIQKALDKAAY